MGELLTVAELERRAKGNVKENTWRQWMREGRLASVNLGRRVFVREEDYEKFIATHLRGSGEMAAPRKRR